MKAVILAAGLGTRLGGMPKPLMRVGGVEIILRTMKLLSPYVSEFVIVASRYADIIDGFLKDKGFNYRIVRHDHPERGNGYSLLTARNHVEGRFILVMGDHVYGEDFVREALKGDKNGVIADRSPRFIDVSEATKIKVEEGRVRDIGKHLTEFDCIDTGFFILDENIFIAADKIAVDGDGDRGKDKEKEITLSELVRAARLPVSYVDGKLWMDVDTKDDIRRANRAIVREAVKSSGDGFISRHLNRKISTFISSMLVNKIKPAHMTVISFLVGVLSSLLVFLSIPLAGILYQLSSILDGCDGEIARASLSTSRKGGYVDSILDRFVDFLFLAFLALIYKNADIALFAIFGSLMVSYTTEKYKAEFGESIYSRIGVMKYIPGKRDERIFIIMLFCLLSVTTSTWVYWMFWVVALLSLFRTIATLLVVITHQTS